MNIVILLILIPIPIPILITMITDGHVVRDGRD